MQVPRRVRQIATFGNGRSHTHITQLADGRYEWRRSPGRLDHPRLSLPPASVLAMVTRVRAGGVRFVVPEVEGETETYRIRRPYSVAIGLLTAREPATTFTACVRAVGQALQELHRSLRPPGFVRVPPLLAELTDWLATGGGPRDAGRLHALVHARLGADRAGVLARWCDELIEQCSEGGALLHGSLGTGQIIAGAAEAIGEVLTGPHVSTGPPEIDLGSFLGQLAELQLTQQPRFASRPADADYAALAEAFAAGYAAAFDTGLARRWGLLTYLNHLRTFATYGTWHDDLAVSVDVIADHIDRGGIDLCPEFIRHDE